MGRPFFVEKTPLPDWGDSGCTPGFCREFEVTFLAGGGDSRDFRFLFGGREGSDGTMLREVDVLSRFLSAPLRDGTEIEDTGLSSTE